MGISHPLNQNPCYRLCLVGFALSAFHWLIVDGNVKLATDSMKRKVRLYIIIPNILSLLDGSCIPSLSWSSSWHVELFTSKSSENSCKCCVDVRCDPTESC